MKTGMTLFLFLAASLLCHGADEPIIVDHGCTDLPSVPAAWIAEAKNSLHIAYGHTSHGSQVTEGMKGLVTFTGGCGGPQFAWNNGGTGGALDLHDYAMGGDCGYYPQWVDNTRNYLNDPANADCNVIIWSWCGQHSGYSQQDMLDRYLLPMTQLEVDYPKVRFVYMTGHLNYWSKTNTDARNQQIRDYCTLNRKILYDFAHIESYDPDDTHFEFANDDCSYWANAGGGTPLGNWAEEWQNTHTQGVDWYSCSCAHSRPLNGNQKAYAAWWLWARIAGWPGVETLAHDNSQLSSATGGTIGFDLDAGHLYGNRNYLLCTTLSGTTPGTPLPGGLATLPINRDSITNYVIQHLNNPVFRGFWGTLDPEGEAATQLVLTGAPSSWVGQQLHFAWAAAYPWDFASNAVAVDIVP